MVSGILKKGNTHIIADMIAEQVDADLFEISTVVPYPDEYEACTETAKQELEEACETATRAESNLKAAQEENERIRQELLQAKQKLEQTQIDLETLKQAAVTAEQVETAEEYVEEQEAAITETEVQETASGEEMKTEVVTTDTKHEADSAAAEVAAVKELVASILPKTVKTPEEQKKADEMAKQAAFKAALAAATHPNRHFIR